MSGSIFANAVGKAVSLLEQMGRYCGFMLLEKLLPAKRNYWCFCTWPGEYAHTMDNPRAVFEAIKDDPQIVKVILRKRGQIPSSAVIEGRNVVVVDAESIRGAYYLAVSKVVLLGYALVGMTSYSRFLTKKHHIIQLWHGIPLKRIGKLFSGEQHWDKETDKYAATVCSSEGDRAIMAAAFAPLASDSVWLTGLPRNDLILKPENELPIDYRRELERLRKRLAGRRFVLYAPTWREGENGIYPFSEQELTRLKALLNQHNAVLGIRAHANKRIEASDPEAGPLFFVNDFPDVNVVLRITDVLVTDYSSIYIDFLLTKKPILYFTYDIDSYVSERGFLYALEDAMANSWFTTFDEFESRLAAALDAGVDDQDRYGKVLSLFHEHTASSGLAVANKIRVLTT